MISDPGLKWKRFPDDADDRRHSYDGSDERRAIEHYPPSDFEPAITDLAEFLSPHDSADMRSRLLLGNGASEMIDMISRLAPKGQWRPGPFTTQYQEYRRSATNAGRAELHWSDGGAKLTSIVNPCNPTGDYMHVEEIKEYISETCDGNSWVVVDESMQPWAGPHWREDSLTSQKEFIQEIQRKRGISVYVIHSWTKIWACPGIRLGSVVCPTAEDASGIKKMQVPWSVNVMALHYLSGCCKADEYMQRTWKSTVEWRSFITDGLKHINFPGVYGEAWSSWIWIDTGSEDLAEAIVEECKAAGVPIRWGKFGYCMPTYIRLGVRKPSSAKVLINTIDRVVEEHRCASE
ncbi:Histidinol-phosphate aminotransferase, putative [Perkinsus marinus ATCC 50983]|uniref:Histidinol-phosphate aminotransferase, putative n=1 Tax=Perkinsus marinus (strain ATCC 50983 / TXsc) TaxID=423536 RepID=C5M1G6_PERM5|nr:Histidinol-phosphate aminotransferase, putative [Perkinsus marinus ATCC 50983]EEQ97173.1 Histidinol-phosphate aminotransferase, putative [Perkinsus marinus ATCC 50983]|eukprot:XP_002764456.1 Histidinol-phosphate aminotransferase, putative [Perkinsus marinus ATCC 50983]